MGVDANDDGADGGELRLLIQGSHDDAVLGFQGWPHRIPLHLHQPSSTTKKQQQIEETYCCFFVVGDG